QPVSRLHHLRLLDPDAIDIGPVGALQVFDHQAIVAKAEAAMTPAHRCRGNAQVATGAPANDGILRLEPDLPLLLRAFFDDQSDIHNSIPRRRSHFYLKNTRPRDQSKEILGSVSLCFRNLRNHKRPRLWYRFHKRGRLWLQQSETIRQKKGDKKSRPTWVGRPG